MLGGDGSVDVEIESSACLPSALIGICDWMYVRAGNIVMLSEPKEAVEVVFTATFVGSFFLRDVASMIDLGSFARFP